MATRTSPSNKILEELYTRIINAFSVKNNGIDSEEVNILTPFWEALQTHLPTDVDAAIILPMLEEALVLRIVSCRLLKDIDPGKSNEPITYKPNLEPWLKTHERLRKVMKEILQHYGQIKDENENTSDISLAAIMAPILKQGEGILEDALEFETRKKSIQKKGRSPRGD